MSNPTAIHSGRSGSNYQGVIRSPSFTIEHDKIFYRVKGKRSRIRLIVEGYQLDVYNALLFEGMNLEIPASDEYRWIEQARDLKNHKGHRAHIEIIDQADGYICVDEIRFSNGPTPVESPARLTKEYFRQLGQPPRIHDEEYCQFLGVDPSSTASTSPDRKTSQFVTGYSKTTSRNCLNQLTPATLATEKPTRLDFSLDIRRSTNQFGGTARWQTGRLAKQGRKFHVGTRTDRWPSASSMVRRKMNLFSFAAITKHLEPSPPETS